MVWTINTIIKTEHIKYQKTAKLRGKLGPWRPSLHFLMRPVFPMKISWVSYLRSAKQRSGETCGLANEVFHNLVRALLSPSFFWTHWDDLRSFVWLYIYIYIYVYINICIPGSSAGWKSSPNAFRLKFQPESCKPQIFARMDFGYFGPIQQDRCLEWIDNQSLDSHRDEQHIFKLGGSQMGNNDVPGYVELVFRFFSPEWREILPFWCLISPEVKSKKLPKKRVRSCQQNFLQPAQITSWLR